MIMPTRYIFLLLMLVELATVSMLLIYHHMMEKTLERRGRRLLKGGDDDDIPILTPTPVTTDDVPAATNKDKSNEIRIGPITRARAKLLEQQVNLFLNKPDVLLNENFILPKSMCYCMIRYVGKEGIARSEEAKHMDQGVLINRASAREEREEAQGDTKEGINTWQSLCRGRETMPN